MLLTKGITFVSGQSRMESLPFITTCLTPYPKLQLSYSHHTQPHQLHSQQTHHLGNHLPIKLHIALSIPVHVQIQLNPIIGRLRNLHIREDNGRGAKLDLCEMQGRKGTWEHGLEHGLDNVFDHLAAGDLDVGPEVGDDVVDEACG
jgi:hypothetical protein